MRILDSVGRVDKRGSVIKSISLPPELAAAAVAQRCGGVKGKFSAYVSDLIEKDLRGDVPRLDAETRREIAALVQELQAGYGPGPASGKVARKSGVARGSSA